MRGRFAVLAVLFLVSSPAAYATTLPPELKAYDFARAYYVEDGGIVIAPQDGFYSSGGVQTPEGIRLMPGQTFIQFDPGHLVMEVYNSSASIPANGAPTFTNAATATKS